MSNLPGVTASHTFQLLQANRNLQNGRPNNIPSSISTHGNPTVLDEFNHGFPSTGLSTASNRWWGSDGPTGDEKSFRKPEANEGKHHTEEFAKNGLCSLMAGNTNPEDVPKEGNAGLQGSGLLSSVRRKAAEEGREALRLGVYRRYGSKKIGRREKMLLLQIFDSSLPSEWRLS